MLCSSSSMRKWQAVCGLEEQAILLRRFTAAFKTFAFQSPLQCCFFYSFFFFSFSFMLPLVLSGLTVGRRSSKVTRKWRKINFNRFWKGCGSVLKQLDFLITPLNRKALSDLNCKTTWMDWYVLKQQHNLRLKTSLKISNSIWIHVFYNKQYFFRVCEIGFLYLWWYDM